MSMAKASSPNLAETLLETAKARRTGVLRFECGPTKKQLVLQSGIVTFAESNLREEHLAWTLVKLNLLNRNQLPEIAALMKAGRTADHAILASSKLDVAGLDRGARELAVVILASVFAWSEYETHFYAGEGLVRRQIDLHMPLTELLVMAARRAVSDHLVLHRFGPLRGTVYPGEKQPENLLWFPLNSAEAFALSLVQEPLPADVLLSLLPAGEGKPEELIQRLALLGLVRLEAAMVAPDAKTPAAPYADITAEQLEGLLRQFEVASLYEILSVEPDASDADIKQAYHDLAKHYHPDRFQSEEHSAALRSLVEKLFTHITGAYATLGDPEARAAYDEIRLKKESQVEAALQARAASDSEQEKMADTLFRAGRLSLSRGDFEKAVKELKECVWLRPGVARYHHYLGLAESEVPRFRKEAEQHLLRALELNKTGVESRLALSKLYLKVNLPRRAEIQLHEVLGWDPDNTEALGLLSRIADDDPAGSKIKPQRSHKF